MGLSCAGCGSNCSRCIDCLWAGSNRIARARISRCSAGACSTGCDINGQVGKRCSITGHDRVTCRRGNTRARRHHINIGDNSGRTSNCRVAVARVGALRCASGPNIGRRKRWIAAATTRRYIIVPAAARDCGTRGHRSRPGRYDTVAGSGTLIACATRAGIALKD